MLIEEKIEVTLCRNMEEVSARSVDIYNIWLLRVIAATSVKRTFSSAESSSCSSLLSQVVEFMTDMTGRLCKLPYMDDVSELDCFKILKKGGGKDSQDEAWYRMISQVQVRASK